MRKTNELAAEYLHWYKKWMSQRGSTPVTFILRHPSEIREAADVSLELKVKQSARGNTATLAALPDYFIRGTLNGAEAKELNSVLMLLQNEAGVSLRDALGLLATYQVLALDSFAAEQKIGIRDMWQAFTGSMSLDAIEKTMGGGSFHGSFAPASIEKEWKNSVLPFLTAYTNDPLEKSITVIYESIPPLATGAVPLHSLREEDLKADSELRRQAEIQKHERRATTEALKKARSKELVRKVYVSGRPGKDDLQYLADQHRFKSSGKINYTKVAEALKAIGDFDVHPQTVTSWCEDYGIE